MSDSDGVPGRRLVLPVALLMAAAFAILVVYNLQGHGSRTMTFQALADAPENATVLDERAVHADRFLESHLDNCLDKGTSVESVALRAEAMQETLVRLTARQGPWVVLWHGVAVRVTVA